jgi:hypothetical protein
MWREGVQTEIRIPGRTVIATGEAAGGAAALTAGSECIKCGIGEEGSQCTWNVGGYQRVAGCLTAGLGVRMRLIVFLL